jgi:NADPH:quinone reductase-like Zn-dependent oxidoreductase
MKAAVYRRYGAPDVVAIEEVATPVPKHNEVLVRIRAATVSSGDWRVRSLEVPRGYRLIMPLVFGVFGPRQKILGTEFSGDVEAVGKSVTRFKPGDAVFGFPGGAMGAHAEYRTMPEDGRIALKPANLGYAEAAALCFGGSTALHYLRDVRASTERYDVIMDCVGNASFRAHGALLNPGGRLVLVASGLADTLSALGRKPEGKRVLAGPASEKPEHLSFLKELAEAGAFRPVIDRIFPFAQIVAAHARVDTGHKRGSVVLEIQA